MKVFEYICYSHMPKEKRYKMDEVSEKCIFSIISCNIKAISFIVQKNFKKSLFQEMLYLMRILLEIGKKKGSNNTSLLMLKSYAASEKTEDTDATPLSTPINNRLLYQTDHPLCQISHLTHSSHRRLI